MYDCPVGTNPCLTGGPGNWWDDFTTVAYVSITGVIGSLWLISMIHRKDTRRPAQYETTSSDESDVPYEDLYTDEIDGMLEEAEGKELSKEILDALAFSHVTEETPRGDVVMLYDNTTESFWWFCNTKDVPYKYLETVCRSYVSAYDCVQVYHGTLEQLARQKKCLEEKEAEAEAAAAAAAEAGDEEPTETPRDTVFASFKSYNKGRGQSRAVSDSSGELVPEESNRYSYRGKLADWEELQRAREVVFVPPAGDAKNVDFAAFKKMQDGQLVL